MDDSPPLYDPIGSIHPCKCGLDLIAPVDQLILTDRWRAEFTQFGGTNGQADGPRIVELDGFAATTVPEPATLLLLGPGLAGLAGLKWRRRRK